MKIIDCLQGSDEWKQARCGRVTASRLGDVLARIKTGEAAARRDYKTEIVVERLTGQPYDKGFINAEMIWGTENEPLARSAYEMATDCLVDQFGFVVHAEIEQAGASPDGLVGEDGVLEIKAPKSATHLQYLMDGKVPSKYEPQLSWALACTGRKWADFVSFDPRLPEHLRLFIVRFPRDDKRILEITAEVNVFLREVDEIIERLNRKAA